MSPVNRIKLESVTGYNGTPFSEWLREMRETERLTVRELGDRAGLDPGLISKVETGQREPTYEFAVKAATAFGADTDFVLGLAGLRDNADSSGAINEIKQIKRVLDQLNPAERDEAVTYATAVIREFARRRRGKSDNRDPAMANGKA